MKGYFIWVGDEWGDYVHGETASKAKSMMWSEWSFMIESWIDMRPIRIPAFDNKPITEKTIIEYCALNQYEFEGEPIDEWTPICECKICMTERQKP